MRTHEAAPSVVLYTPSVVAAYTVEELLGSTSSEVTGSIGRPTLLLAHVAPPFTDLYTGAAPITAAPAYSTCELVGSTVSPYQGSQAGRPLLASTQLAPASVVLNTPPQSVPR